MVLTLVFSRSNLMLLGLLASSGLFFLDMYLIDASASSVSSEHLHHVSSIAYFPPPLKQISEGINPSNVTCTEGKELVLKQSNGLPACINPSSVEKLIARG